MNRVRPWLQLARASYLPVVVVPIAVGATYAVWDAYELRWLPLLLTLGGGATLFLGGMAAAAILEITLGHEALAAGRSVSRLEGPDVIAAGLVGLPAAGAIAALMLVVALLCGVLLAEHAGTFAFGIGFAGLLVAILYAVPDIGLRDLGHGLGEVAALIALGPLAVLGGYASQSGSFTLGAVLASLPPGLFGAAIVYDHHLARFLRDDPAGGMSLAMDLGEERARFGCWILPGLAYAAILLNVAFGEYPPATAWALATIPILAWKLMGFGGSDPEECEELTRATAAVHSLTGLVLTAALAMSGVRPL